MSIYKKPLVLFVITVLFLCAVHVAASTSVKTHLPVSVNINIKARPEFIWLSIHEARTKDPGLTDAELLSENALNSVVKETFQVPILGAATCILQLSDLPPNRIDYRLIESNLFSAFDGSWTLFPGSNGRSTRLNLSCNANPKKVVPQFLLRMIIANKIGKRLEFVKILAENKELQMALH